MIEEPIKRGCAAWQALADDRQAAETVAAERAAATEAALATRIAAKRQQQCAVSIAAVC